MYTSDQFKQSIAIPEDADWECDGFGLDTLEHCLNKKYFCSYPSVNYKFNQLGYRHGTLEQYRGDEILAVGDSFTVGLGVNVEQTWPECLSRLLNYPVLNFSLNGASNDWMARKTKILLQYFQPKAVIVHYSITHRRERPNADWTDYERIMCDPLHTDEENLSNWQHNQEKLTDICGAIPLIHTAIWNWHTPHVPDVLVPPRQDLARDSFHYGPKTHQFFATSLLEFL